MKRVAGKRRETEGKDPEVRSSNVFCLVCGPEPKYIQRKASDRHNEELDKRHGGVSA